MDVRKIFSRYASQNHTVPSNHAQPAQEADKDNTLASLDFIFDLVKERMVAQLARIDGLDNKANFIMGAGTALVSIALTLQAAVLTSHTSGYCTPIIPTFIHVWPPLLRHAIPLLPLIITYIIVIYLSQKAYKIDSYHDIPANPDALYTYLEQNQDVATIKVDIYDRMRVNFTKNEEKINAKARWIQYALWLLELEGISLVLLLLYRSLC
jgi:hypothetical protein